MKILKKALIFLAILSMSSFVACGKPSDSGNGDKNSSNTNSNSESSSSFDSSLPGTEDLGGEKDKPFDTPLTPLS